MGSCGIHAFSVPTGIGAYVQCVSYVLCSWSGSKELAMVLGNLEVLLALRRARTNPSIPGNARKDLEALIPYVFSVCLLDFLCFALADISV